MARARDRSIESFFGPLPRKGDEDQRAAPAADAVVIVRCHPGSRGGDGASKDAGDSRPESSAQGEPPQTTPQAAWQEDPPAAAPAAASPARRKRAPRAASPPPGSAAEPRSAQAEAGPGEAPPSASPRKRTRRAAPPAAPSDGAQPSSAATGAVLQAAPAADAAAGGGAAGPPVGSTAAAAAAADDAAAPGPSGGDGLTKAQQMQVAANRNQALARLACSSADKPGAPPLELAALLVEPSWRAALEPELEKAYFKALEAFWQAECGIGGTGRAARAKPVYPPRDVVFRAFNSCPLDQVKVVVLGQDPYHGPGQAMGLSFSVPRGTRLPPSLLNIFKEAKADLGWERVPQHGDLSGWAVQGVLLLNATLSVREAEANSHAGRGWEKLTDAAIAQLSRQGRPGLVFLLWGKSAEAKKSLVAGGRGHHVLTTVHPSPLSASRGFFGCRHFSTANKLLAKQGDQPVDWAAGLF